VTDETRARFLAAIAAQLPADRIAELHLFPAIRQGGMESGVAVVAVAREEPAPPEGAPDDAPGGDPNASPESVEPVDSTEANDSIGSGDAEAQSTEQRPEESPEESIERAPPTAPRRYTVYSARYRHTLKGPDRGKWEVNVTEEADAPLLTVDAVVRGVQRRSGDADEIVRLSGDEVRGMVVETVVSR